MNNLYKIEKQNGMYVVLTIQGNVVQYRSTKKAFCSEWIMENSGENDE